MDLKGTPKNEQNALLDSFVTITSSKPDLESSSFLSSLDMDPSSGVQLGHLQSPGSSRISLPLATTPGPASSQMEGVFATTLGSPPPSGTLTGTAADSAKNNEPNQRREVFSDIRRLVSFGRRRDAM